MGPMDGENGEVMCRWCLEKPAKRGKDFCNNKCFFQWIAAQQGGRFFSIAGSLRLTQEEMGLPDLHKFSKKAVLKNVFPRV